MITSDRVEMSLPARADMLSLVRLQVAAAATQMNLGIDLIEDLRLAVDELCLTLLARPVEADSRLDVVLLWNGESVEVVCGVTMPTPDAATVMVGTEPAPQTPALSAALSDHVLNALVDEHGDFSADGRAVSWLRKRFPLPAAPSPRPPR